MIDSKDNTYLQAEPDWAGWDTRNSGSFRLAAGYVLPEEEEEDLQADTIADGLLMLLEAAAACDARVSRCTCASYTDLTSHELMKP